MKYFFILLFCSIINVVECVETYGAITNNGQRVTFITSTSAIPVHPSTYLLERTQASFAQIPEFQYIPKIIVFDYPREKLYNESAMQRNSARFISQVNYEEYKRRVKHLVDTDPTFQNTLLIFQDHFQHLAGGVKEAMKHVTTKYVFIHQHDFELIKPFDMEGILDSMEINQNIKYVRLNLINNIALGKSEVYIDDKIDGNSFVSLCRSFNWSDHEHFASKEYYTNFVFPNIGNEPIAMEHALSMPIRSALVNNPYLHSQYGIYIYGEYNEAPYVRHLDGNNWSDPQQ